MGVGETDELTETMRWWHGVCWGEGGINRGRQSGIRAKSLCIHGSN